MNNDNTKSMIMMMKSIPLGFLEFRCVTCNTVAFRHATTHCFSLSTFTGFVFTQSGGVVTMPTGSRHVADIICRHYEHYYDIIIILK